MFIRRSIFAVGLMAGFIALNLGTTAVSAEQDPPGKVLMRTSFLAIDGNSDGKATLRELVEQTNRIMLSMDADDDGLVSEEEFGQWGFGTAEIADKGGRQLAHETAFRIVFDLWDVNNDQMLTQEEFDSAAVRSFGLSDRDGDDTLSVDEYLDNFIISIVLRAALTP